MNYTKCMLAVIVLCAICSLNILSNDVCAQGITQMDMLDDFGNIQKMSIGEKYTHLYKLWTRQQRTDITQIEKGQVQALIEALINELRKGLFRNQENIQAFYKTRYRVFVNALARKERAYQALQDAVRPNDIMKRDTIFTDMQKLEVKVFDIAAMVRKIDKRAWIDERISRFNELINTYKTIQLDDVLERTKQKKKIYLFLKDTFITSRFSESLIEKIDQHIKDVTVLLGMYGYWDEASEKGNTFIDTHEPAYDPNLPVKTWDSSEMVGRRNYVKTITDKNNDRRLENTFHNRDPKKIFKNVNEGREMKEKILSRDE